jgi:hypothetical protein
MGAPAALPGLGGLLRDDLLEASGRLAGGVSHARCSIGPTTWAWDKPQRVCEVEINIPGRVSVGEDGIVAHKQVFAQAERQQQRRQHRPCGDGFKASQLGSNGNHAGGEAASFAGRHSELLSPSLAMQTIFARIWGPPQAPSSFLQLLLSCRLEEVALQLHG